MPTNSLKKIHHHPLRKKTTIIATLGPSSSNKQTIKEMIEQGTNIFRLNFSHGTHETHLQLIQIIQEISEELKLPVGILGDLSGPKIRIGTFENGQIELLAGDTFYLTTDSSIVGNQNIVSTTYQYLCKDVKAGDTILLDDGNLSMECIDVENDKIKLKVIDGGILKNKKGINLPNIPLSIESVTEKDKNDLKFILENNLDFVALSFVRNSQCILDLRELIGDNKIKVIAKIEKPESIKDFEKIMLYSDAIMIARGDLGVEVPLEMVPHIQKEIIATCMAKGVPVITATQMLESMITNPRPTRAETTDVFNAIIDGSDAVMLSGETASGKYPIYAVKTMSKIAIEAEALAAERYDIQSMKKFKKLEIQDSIAHMACQSAIEIGAKAIVTLTIKGNTAQRLASYHNPVPVIALSPNEEVCRRISIFYGVFALQVAKLPNTDSMFLEAERIVKELGLAKSGDIIVIVAGIPMLKQGNTNLMKLHRIS